MCKISFFGGLRLETSDGALPRFATRKARDLFAYMILTRGHPQSREHLTDLFWPDSESGRARPALSTTVWRIQKVLRTNSAREIAMCDLVVNSDGLTLKTAPSTIIDVGEFETRYNMAKASTDCGERAALYARAVALYAGPLLPECREDWCILEREHLQSMYLTALEKLVDYHAERREYDKAIGFGTQLLDCEPLYEDVQRQLIELQLAAGRPTLAVRQYRRLEELLQRELGMAPMPETQQVVSDLLAGDDRGETTHRPSPMPMHGPKPVPDVRDELADTIDQLEELATLCDLSSTRLRQVVDMLRRHPRQAAPERADAKDLPLGVRYGAARTTRWASIAKLRG